MENVGKNGHDNENVNSSIFLYYIVIHKMNSLPACSYTILLVHFRVVARQCTRATEVCNYKIEPGMIIQANVWQLHYDKANWGGDPTKFDPLR